jgi:hypothetical protein
VKAFFKKVFLSICIILFDLIRSVDMHSVVGGAGPSLLRGAGVSVKRHRTRPNTVAQVSVH